MGLFSKKSNQELKEAPLGYWEEESYMQVVPEEPSEELLDSVIDRVAGMEEIQIIDKHELTDSEPGRIKLRYENEEYEVGFYPSKFSLPEFYIKNYYFSNEELEKLRNAQTALTIFMKFNKNSKKSYQVQMTYLQFK